LLFGLIIFKQDVYFFLKSFFDKLTQMVIRRKKGPAAFLYTAGRLSYSSCPKNIDTDGFQDGSKPNCFNTSKSESLNPGSAIIFRHGGFNPSTPSVSLFEFIFLFIGSSFGNPCGLHGVSKLIVCLSRLDRAVIQAWATATGVKIESLGNPTFFLFSDNRGMPLWATLYLPIFQKLKI
jgi:hypothetical protein